MPVICSFIAGAEKSSVSKRHDSLFRTEITAKAYYGDRTKKPADPLPVIPIHSGTHDPQQCVDGWEDLVIRVTLTMEYRALRAREYARCRIAEYSSLRIAGVSLRGRRLGNWFLVLSSEWRSEKRAECYGSG